MNRLLSLLAVLALATAGCGLKKSPTAQGKAEATTAYGTVEKVEFPHQPHVEGDVACNLCHVGIDKATRLDPKVRHIQLPKKNPDCLGCHDPVPDLKVPARADRKYGVNFDHAAHLPRVKGDCRKCHQQLPESGMSELPLPAMATCTSCHNHQADFAIARCTPCHTDMSLYGKPLAAFRHQGEWLRNHGDFTRPSAEACAACHDQTFCADCHSATTVPARQAILFPEAVDKEFIHRADYISRHTIEVSAQPESCRRCHGSQFCIACHTLQGVTTQAVNVRDPHPAGWATNKASGNFHGDAARRNIVNCAGCHDQGADAVCVACHKTINPHPPSWTSRHSPADWPKNKTCQICHPV